MLLNDACLKAMQKLIDNGVQVESIVTDPPYHLQSIVERFNTTLQEEINKLHIGEVNKED